MRGTVYTRGRLAPRGAARAQGPRRSLKKSTECSAYHCAANPGQSSALQGRGRRRSRPTLRGAHGVPHGPAAVGHSLGKLRLPGETKQFHHPFAMDDNGREHVLDLDPYTSPIADSAARVPADQLR
jgi:hypothetical protein